jgi:hypothetical protein
MSDFLTYFLLRNFSLAMLITGLFFMILERLIRRNRRNDYEIIFHWLMFFSVGLTGLYVAFFQVFYPDIVADMLGWHLSPFQFQLAAANIGFGMVGLFSLKASYSFRLAAVLANVCWMWGDVLSQLYQFFMFQNYSIGNVGTWFWMSLVIPFILLLCIWKIKPKYY